MLRTRLLSFPAVAVMSCVALGTVCSGTAALGDDIDFNRDVRPILSDKCNYCHGPDESTREAGLRLDLRESAVDVLESGELLDRIHSDDEDMRMPPLESKLSLTSAEKETLKQWIDAGAPYAAHWAFELLPDEIAQPPSAQAGWARQDLDRFVLAQLEAADLSPNAEASAQRWLRRVTLDLTGLPPTQKEIDQFRTACETDLESAYSITVDGLLDSVAFGEHMAVNWLDLSRYADSYGYQSDKLNTQWPYRDWVVRAFNQNLPYDQFLTWQLAGDLLPEPTRDQLLATAFNRIHRLNNEGGAVFEEWRVENVSDRVHTFGTAVLGLTMECTRCHDHKYDPITMRDYYSLSAFFNSIDESGVYDRSEKVPCPSMMLPSAEQRKVLAKALVAQDLAEQRYRSACDDAFIARSVTGGPGDATPTIPDLRVALSFDRDFDNAVKEIYHPSESDRNWTKMPELVTVEGTSVPQLAAEDADDIPKDSPEEDPKEIPDEDPDKVSADVANSADAENPGENSLGGIVHERRALKLDGERGVTVHGIEPLDRWTPFSVVVTFKETKRVADRSLIAHHTRGTDCGYNGWDLTIVDGFVESRLYRVWPGNALGVRTIEPIPANQWHQLAATYDGSSRAEGLRIYLNGKALATTVLRDEVKKSANVKVDHGGQFVVGQRFRARGLDGGLIDDVRLYTRDLTPVELRYLATGEFDEATPQYVASAVDESARAAMAELTESRKAVVMAEEAMNEIPIMREMESPRETHILARGMYDAETSDETRVSRDVISQLPLPFPKDTPRNRLGLARWVTHPSHPLTARVTVNQMWGNFFASPLVRTPENFGLQGELPTHPALLDWLARDFIDSGWDVKRFCKNIVLSATYRQDSIASERKLARDPENRLLARGPSYRYSAEQIRDIALAASGLMNPEVGGPPVSPYQPGDDLWKESNGMSPPYQQSVGESLYRRSLYSVWKRTTPLPNMMAFDSTTREVCTVKRSRTNTPLQALVLLNDVQFVEAARVLAQQTLTTSEPEKSIRDAFIRLTSREPDAAEAAALHKLYQEEQKFYLSDPSAAEQRVKQGDANVLSEVPAADLAAMTTVCQVILNLDSTIWKR